MHRHITLLCVALLTLSVTSELHAQNAPEVKAVLVTGASTGIGRKITEKLAADGYFVYAGARKDADLQTLAAIKNVQPIRLDVTSAQDIESAVALISKSGRGLHGLVNNAGVASLGTLADMSAAEFDTIMNVNVYGPYRVTKAFAPLITAQKGRIVNIGSISGVLAGKQFGPYAMSKHAVEAFTDTLAAEMTDAGVRVSVVEPGSFNSEIAKNSLRRQGLDPKAGDRSQLKEPDEVAEAVEHALSEAPPKPRYMVVPNQREAEFTIRRQIQRLVELNEGQPYTYDRAALIKMLDEALVGSRPRVK
jgi:NAD(P)-dependent dehydrogenase (short-subunit alcohol dehydrogenase family)